MQLPRSRKCLRDDKIIEHAKEVTAQNNLTTGIYRSIWGHACAFAGVGSGYGPAKSSKSQMRCFALQAAPQEHYLTHVFCRLRVAQK